MLLKQLEHCVFNFSKSVMILLLNHKGDSKQSFGLDLIAAGRAHFFFHLYLRLVLQWLCWFFFPLSLTVSSYFLCLSGKWLVIRNNKRSIIVGSHSIMGGDIMFMRCGLHISTLYPSDWQRTSSRLSGVGLCGRPKLFTIEINTQCGILKEIAERKAPGKLGRSDRGGLRWWQSWPAVSRGHLQDRAVPLFNWEWGSVRSCYAAL